MTRGKRTKVSIGDVTVPDVLEIPENLRALRTAGVFQFRARLAGSIRKVLINGFLAV